MKRLAVAAVLVLGWAAPAGAQLETFKDCDGCPEMVVIPAGDFVMGSPASERGRDRDEGPQHPVSIRQAFALGKYEVTRGEYAAFVRESGHVTSASGCDSRSGQPRTWRNPGFAQSDRDPVVCVSWRDAKVYVSWLSRKTGLEYRLPSEAEWEYAARGGTTTARHWGPRIGSGRTNCDGCGSRWDDRQPAPVGSFAANPFGLHDMLGNSREWVEDCYLERYELASGDGRARSVGGCDKRVMRGGSWESSAKRVRAANRNGRGELSLDNDFGFRVVRTLSSKAFERIFRAGASRETTVPGAPEVPAPEVPPLATTPAPEAPPIARAPAPEAPPIATTPAPEAPPIARAPAPEAPPIARAPAPEAPPIARAPAPEAPPIGGGAKSAAEPTELPELPELPDLPSLDD